MVLEACRRVCPRIRLYQVHRHVNIGGGKRGGGLFGLARIERVEIVSRWPQHEFCQFIDILQQGLSGAVVSSWFVPPMLTTRKMCTILVGGR